MPLLGKLLDEYEEKFQKSLRATRRSALDQKDSVLITYADIVATEGQPPLATLTDFLNKYVGDLVSTIHLLPFYPSSSDDGFSVTDYRSVRKELGSWGDIASLGRAYGLVFDAVINHASVQSRWFSGFIRREQPYQDYFIERDRNFDHSMVFRPRESALFSEFETDAGPRSVWTTFGSDQADLNYRNPEVLLQIVDLLLHYVERGAEMIRLDAIAFLWKESGTICLHLPQTHAIIKLLRAVTDAVAPWVKLITETNVPHKDNVSYIGNGRDEASLVYNFALPPLVLNSFASQDGTTLSGWAADLQLPGQEASFFNFLASHDGIGLTPAQGLLTEGELRRLADLTESAGGFVSYGNGTSGNPVPYELNINLLDAISAIVGDEPLEQARAFLTAHSIMLALKGVPGIYAHSLLGSRSWHEGAASSGRPRTINRELLDYGQLMNELDDTASERHRILAGFRRMLLQRARRSAFAPGAGQVILDFGRQLLAVLRHDEVSGDSVLCLHNFSASAVAIDLAMVASHLACAQSELTDLLCGEASSSQLPNAELDAYGAAWLSRADGRTYK